MALNLVSITTSHGIQKCYQLVGASKGYRVILWMNEWWMIVRVRLIHWTPNMISNTKVYRWHRIPWVQWVNCNQSVTKSTLTQSWVFHAAASLSYGAANVQRAGTARRGRRNTRPETYKSVIKILLTHQQHKIHIFNIIDYHGFIHDQIS